MCARFLRLFAVIGLLLNGTAAFAEEGENPYDILSDILTVPVRPGVVAMCHGFNCRYREEVFFAPKDMAEIQKLMRPGKASAASERMAIGSVMAWFDKWVGPHLGSTRHVAQAGARYSGDRGQFDCFDSTHNATLMLRQLQALGLLLHHRVVDPVSRKGPHTTAVMAEVGNGTPWVVDGWTRGYGEVPDIMPVSIWMDSDYPPIASQPAVLRPH